MVPPRRTRRQGDEPASTGHRNREVPRWPPGDPDGRSQTQPPPAPSRPQDPGGQADLGDSLARLPEMLKVSEVAAILRVGRNQLYEAVARGELRAVRIGRTIRIPKMPLLDLTAPPAQAKRDRLTQVTPW